MQTQENVSDPVQSAKDAGLRYVSDTKPGIVRKRSGKSFRYVDADGKPVKDLETLAWIKSLVIPPAWTNIWICPSSQGHLWVTGRDAKGRKQSRYHPRWREVSTELAMSNICGSTLPTYGDRPFDSFGWADKLMN
jgi:DNA topoisomerase-1